MMEIVITRSFAASREAVFAEWTTAEALLDWFAPHDWEGVAAAFDARPGGAWRVEFRARDSDRRFSESGIVRELHAPDRLVLTLRQHEGTATGPETTITVTFEEEPSGGTRMTFQQRGFDTLPRRDGNEEGWRECFARLEAHLEIRALFATWFAASERRDLEASMAPIAAAIVAYEHVAPMEVTDVGELRAICKAGFDRATGAFRWDIPDLHVIVRGDVAVTWGLNRMRSERDELWSRGTRIFRKLDGRWQMIHQHVSFPIDPATGTAVMAR